MAFPAGMLSAPDWSMIMSHLDRHFGVDAVLETTIQQEVERYLVRNGGQSAGVKTSGSLPRITATDRFIAKHRGAIRLWNKGRLKSLSDCMGCHNTRN